MNLPVRLLPRLPLIASWGERVLLLGQRGLHVASLIGSPLHKRLRAWPVYQLLHPRDYLRATIWALSIGLLVGGGGWLAGFWPRWVMTAIILLCLLPVGILKWRAEYRQFGWVVMLLCVLLTSQGLHSIEHIIQWVQYHWFAWTLRQSNGLLSAANAEWVHFVWNWAVLLVALALLKGGIRNGWMWILLGVATAHTIEHTYTFVRHLEVLAELRNLGVTNVTAQGLPGIFGRDGWLARSSFTQGTFLCSLPGLTTATRLDVHFWWNVIEMSFVLLAGHLFLKKFTAEQALFKIGA